MIKVKRATEGKPGTLEIKVRIGGNGANTGNVKDLKQLSGEHLTSPAAVRSAKPCSITENMWMRAASCTKQ